MQSKVGASYVEPGSIPAGSSLRRSDRGATSGQSLVEFVLIVPILMILLIGIADLGRVFAAGITVEGATRDGAELGARSYLKENPSGPPTPGAYYQDLHMRIAKVVCSEIKSLPNTTFDASTGTCPSMPLTVCIHDGHDDACDSQTFGATPPSGCTIFSPSANNLPVPPPAGENKVSVEVRVCYQFDPITRSAFFSFPSLFLQDARSFTVADY